MLLVKPGTIPKFCKARAVPFSINGVIERELDRLEAAGIMESVTHSDWAALIVAVSKKGGKFCICWDYKVMTNGALDVDQYPLPNPCKLFTTLAGGKVFTKLDLSQAYH